MSKTSRLIIIIGLILFTAYCLYPSLDYYYLTSEETRNKMEETSLGVAGDEGLEKTEYERLKDVFARSIKLGLDLKGGLYMVLQADYEKLKELQGRSEELTSEEKTEAIERVMNKIQNRIDVAGVSEISMRRQGEDRILIQIPGESSSERVEGIVSTTGQLSFKAVDEELSTLNAGRTPDELRADTELQAELQNEQKQLSFVYEKNEFGRKVPTEVVILEKEELLSGDRLTTASMQFNNYGEPIVSFSLDSQGAKRFGEITAESIGQRVAIVLDGNVMSAPNINEPIPGGEAQISGRFSQEEAIDLALILKSGSLPVPIKVVSKDVVGAKLGIDLRNRALNALQYALLAILIFMLVYYRFAGLVACIALILNGVMVVAFLGSFGLAISLSGIAGLLLTIGMSIDANVIIFERIREEHRQNPDDPIGVIIRRGYERAFWSIFDANVTTLIAAFVLFYYGNGALQGFATTLFMGIVISMFTALFFTRFIFDTLLDNRIIKRYSSLLL